jgi:hypothetical protein
MISRGHSAGPRVVVGAAPSVAGRTPYWADLESSAPAVLGGLGDLFDRLVHVVAVCRAEIERKFLCLLSLCYHGVVANRSGVVVLNR